MSFAIIKYWQCLKKLKIHNDFVMQNFAESIKYLYIIKGQIYSSVVVGYSSITQIYTVYNMAGKETILSNNILFIKKSAKDQGTWFCDLYKVQVAEADNLHYVLFLY